MLFSVDRKDYNKKGIYVIHNRITNRLYIGKTKRSFEYRYDLHMQQLKIYTHHNSKLQRDFNQYPLDTFEFSILEIIEDDTLIDQREKELLTSYATDYKLYNVLDNPRAKKRDLARMERWKNRHGKGV